VTSSRYRFSLRANPPGHAGGKRQATFVMALDQAEQLFGASAATGPAARPLPLFYGLSQAGRALVATRTPAGPWKPAATESGRQPERTTQQPRLPTSKSSPVAGTLAPSLWSLAHSGRQRCAARPASAISGHCCQRPDDSGSRTSARTVSSTFRSTVTDPRTRPSTPRSRAFPPASASNAPRRRPVCPTARLDRGCARNALRNTAGFAPGGVSSST